MGVECVLRLSVPVDAGVGVCGVYEEVLSPPRKVFGIFKELKDIIRMSSNLYYSR